MKIRNHRKKEWWFFPPDSSTLRKGSCYVFKYKSDLMSFLNKNFAESLNGVVRLEEKCFGHSGTLREWFVWYNDYKEDKESYKIVLKQQNFRGKKYIFKPYKVSKSSKKYFAFSNKVITLMCNIEGEEGLITKKNAEKLVKLFYKRGFQDFEPDEDDWAYINGHITDGIQFSYWSDRCNWLRTKTIIEYFKQQNLI